MYNFIKEERKLFMTNLSPLQIERLKYQPKLPASLANGINHLISQEGSATQSVANQEEIKALFKNDKREQTHPNLRVH